MKHLIITILFILNISNSFCQTFSRKIDWTENSINKKFPYDFTNKYQQSPNIFSYAENININNTNPQRIEFIPINTKILEYSPLEDISNNFDFSWKVNKSRSDNYLQVIINPIRKNNHGEIEVITEFKITITESKNRITQSRTGFSRKNSFLSTGNWYKIAVSQDNIYKISYDKLISLGFSNPEKIALYGSGGEQLSYYVEDNISPNINQIPLYIEKGSDGIFNSGDYIMFYVTGPNHWKYDSAKDFFWLNKHNYSSNSYYFLTETDSPLRINSKEISENATQTSNMHIVYSHHEVDNKNIIESGRMWFGESFDIETTQSFNFNFPNIITNSESKIELGIMTQSKSESYFTINIDGETFKITTEKTNYSAYQKGIYSKSLFNFKAKNSSQTVGLTYNKPFPSSVGWLDYITINNWCKTTYNNNLLTIQNPSVISPSSITEFSVNNCNSSLRAWEVTNIFNPSQLKLLVNGTVGTFKNNTDILQKQIIFNPANALEPTFISSIQNQNIQGNTPTQLVIITTPELYSSAERLALFHKEKDNISYSIYTPNNIYNEFSSGSPDICAIRNFLSYLYRLPSSPFQYLLFLGNGSFNNTEQWISENNLLPTYQSFESLTETNSFVSDDFFGLLDIGEGEGNGLLDIAIGRIPAENRSEAETVINKIEQYLKNSNAGLWQNKITFIADDGDNNLHAEDAEKLNNYINNNHPEIITQKIYLDSYKMEKTDIERYPTVNNAINNSVKQGTLILNYTGHGSPTQLAHEAVITKEDIDTWNNTNLPVIITASCSFSKWDNENKSTGEYLLMKENAGAVALFSTSRIVYSSNNFTLNYNFYKNLKKKDASGNFIKMGDIIRNTKIAMPNDLNKRNFSLLGDPLLRLQLPTQEIVIKDIISNGISNTDTLKAFNSITIKANIANSGIINPNFNGSAYCTVYDKKSQEITLGNKGEDPFSFNSWKNIIFQGTATVNNGNFELTFIVPKDINYKYGDGKISISAYSSNSSAAGFKSQKVGGTGNNIIDDNNGPEINLFMNNTNFTNGGLTSNYPKLLGILTDESGINTMNNSLGHELSITLDNKTDSKININEFYISEPNTYKKGKVEFNLEKLSNGPHSIELKAWDIMNNSNINTLDFIVANDSKLAIQHLLNYPNPFTEHTTFYFNHNKPYSQIEAIIQIYTPSGKLVKTLKKEFYTDSFKSEPIEWDGLDDFGNKIGRGVYIYRLKLRSNKSETAELIEKLVILK